MPVVFHIGAPKCGSSALQSALTSQPRFESSVLGSAGYFCIDDRFRLRPVRAPHFSATGLLQSVGFVPTQLPDAGQVRGIARDLNEQLRNGISPVLSSEAWLNSEGFFDSGLLDQLDGEVEILLWVRPQVEFLNSAWWQWGAWSDIADVERWCMRRLPRCRWEARVRDWSQRYPLRYRVRLAQEDVVADFCSVYGIEGLPRGAGNVSLDAALLRFLQLRRELRPTPHENRVVSALQRYLAQRGGDAPWIIPAELAELVIRRNGRQNKELMQRLDAGQAQRMAADPRWWDAAVYRDRIVEPCGPVELTAPELADIAEDLAQALVKADNANIGLQRRLLEESPDS